MILINLINNFEHIYFHKNSIPFLYSDKRNTFFAFYRKFNFCIHERYFTFFTRRVYTFLHIISIDLNVPFLICSDGRKTWCGTRSRCSTTRSSKKNSTSISKWLANTDTTSGRPSPSPSSTSSKRLKIFTIESLILEKIIAY